MELSGKVALVTGAGAGIGRAIALRFAQEGAHVIVNDIRREDAEKTGEEIRELGARALPVHADISSGQEVETLVESGVGHFGGIDILVNNAGIGGSSILVQDMPAEEWERVIAVNLNGPFYCSRAVIPPMIGRGGGKIVNIASIAARRMSNMGGAGYTASKYGLVGFSHHLAFELASYGINVNVICPGATLTPLVESRITEEIRTAVTRQIPLGRWITPQDVAEAALFLSSDRAAMITGTVLEVDGGQLLGISSDYQDDLQRRKEISECQLREFVKGK